MTPRAGRPDDGFTLVELMIGMVLSVMLLGVLSTALLLVLKTAVGESSTATSKDTQNADLIPAQLEANAGVQSIARTFSADILNVVASTQVTRPTVSVPLTSLACTAPASTVDPRLSTPDVPLVRLTYSISGVTHTIDYRYSRNTRHTQALLTRYDCPGSGAAFTATARKLAAGLSSTAVPSPVADVTTAAQVAAGNLKTYRMTLAALTGRVYAFDASMRADSSAVLPAGSTDSFAALLQGFTSLKTADINKDGRVDDLVALFGSSSTTGCGTGWQVAGAGPGGATWGQTAIPNTGQSSVHLALVPDVTAAQDTGPAPTTFLVSFTPASTCPDLAGLTTEQVLDGASPLVLPQTASTPGLVLSPTPNGRMDTGDVLTITFSEPLDPATVPSTVIVTENGGAGSSTLDTIAIAGSGTSTGKNITSGALSLGTHQIYPIVGSNKDASVDADVGMSADKRSITITLKSTCSGNGCARTTNTSLAPFAFLPSSTLKDAAGNPAVAATGNTIATWQMF